MHLRPALLTLAIAVFQSACADDMSLAGPSTPVNVAQLQVWVGDSSGMALPGSHVLLTSMDDVARPVTHTATADSDGMVILDVARQGHYELRVLSI